MLKLRMESPKLLLRLRWGAIGAAVLGEGMCTRGWVLFEVLLRDSGEEKDKRKCEKC
jgi:hypothetical protein